MLRPSAPGWLADVFGRAARQRGTVAAALDRRPILPGQIDTSSGLPVIKVPRLSGGAATAVQASQNAAIQDTDPTTASVTAEVGTIAGQVDGSTALFELSQPGFDKVVASDLAADYATDLDQQIVNGTGASGQLRGLLNVAGSLSGTSAATTVAGQISAVWSGFRSLSGTSGIGVPNPGDYLLLVSPGRFAWWNGGSGDTSVPGGDLRLPGQIVLSGAIPRVRHTSSPETN